MSHGTCFPVPAPAAAVQQNRTAQTWMSHITYMNENMYMHIFPFLQQPLPYNIIGEHAITHSSVKSRYHLEHTHLNASCHTYERVTSYEQGMYV